MSEAGPELGLGSVAALTAAIRTMSGLRPLWRTQAKVGDRIDREEAYGPRQGVPA